MQATFANPPRSCRMLQIIHGFPKNRTPGELADFLCKHGYGGVVCNVGFDEYLESEEEWARFLAGFAECKRRGLRVWLYDEKGYPSGKAGTLTLRGHPEFETRGILCAKTLATGFVRHAMPVDERVEGAPMKVLACPVVSGVLELGDALDLTDQVAEGQEVLEWEDDFGDWAILSFHLRRMREGTHIICNVSDDSPYINIADPAAVGRFIEVTHEAYAARLGDDLRDTVEAIFTDEPSLMTMYLKEEAGLLPAAPWAPGLFERFEAENGYDLTRVLPALFADCGATTRRVRIDFWHVISQLVEESFWGQIEDWCVDHGIASSGHALTEEHLWWQVGFEGDMFRDLRRLHIPGIDQLSSDAAGLVRAGCVPIEKFVSSVAHAIGAPGCMSETSSHVQRMGNVPLTDDQRFGTMNFQYVLGLTQITSYYGMDEMVPEVMREFNDHIGRLGWMLTGGVHVAPVAVYYPVHTCWAGLEVRATTAYQACPGELAAQVSEVFAGVSRQLLWNQWDFDYVDDQAIAEADITEGALHLRDEGFGVVVLPHTVAVPLSTYRKLEAFVQAGGVLISCGELPSMASTDGTDEDVQAISGRLAASVRVEVVEAPEAVPETLGIFARPDLALSEACPDVLYCHRVKAGRHVYFVANCGDVAASLEATVAVCGEAEAWVPRTGEVRALAYEVGAEGTRFALSLGAYEGVFVVFAEGAEVAGGDAGNTAGCCFQRTGECGGCAAEHEVPA